MLGRKDYTRAEFEHGKAAVEQQLDGYKKLVRVAVNGTTDTRVQATLQDLADEYGVSAERIRQIESKALKSMRSEMAAVH